jgi:hypothetical protein
MSEAAEQGATRPLLGRSAPSTTAAWMGTVGLAGVGAWVAIVLLLHFIKTDLDPIDIYISDYAIGDHGWLMRVAFYAVGVGTLGIAFGWAMSVERTRRATLSILLTAVAGLGFVVAGTFTTDPTGATETTTEGGLHLLGAVMVFPVTVLASFLLRGVLRRDARWQRFASRIRWFPWVLLVGFLVTFFAPGLPVGLTQRVFAAIIMAWLAVLAWELRAQPIPE